MKKVGMFIEAIYGVFLSRYINCYTLLVIYENPLFFFKLLNYLMSFVLYLKFDEICIFKFMNVPNNGLGFKVN